MTRTTTMLGGLAALGVSLAAFAFAGCGAAPAGLVAARSRSRPATVRDASRPAGDDMNDDDGQSKTDHEADEVEADAEVHIRVAVVPQEPERTKAESSSNAMYITTADATKTMSPSAVKPSTRPIVRLCELAP